MEGVHRKHSLYSIASYRVTETAEHVRIIYRLCITDIIYEHATLAEFYRCVMVVESLVESRSHTYI